MLRPIQPSRARWNIDSFAANPDTPTRPHAQPRKVRIGVIACFIASIRAHLNNHGLRASFNCNYRVGVQKSGRHNSAPKSCLEMSPNKPALAASTAACIEACRLNGTSRHAKRVDHDWRVGTESWRRAQAQSSGIQTRAQASRGAGVSSGTTPSGAKPGSRAGRSRSTTCWRSAEGLRYLGKGWLRRNNRGRNRYVLRLHR